MTPRMIRTDRGSRSTVIWCAACGARAMVFTAQAEDQWAADHLTNQHNDSRRAASLLGKRRQRRGDA